MEKFKKSKSDPPASTSIHRRAIRRPQNEPQVPAPLNSSGIYRRYRESPGIVGHPHHALRLPDDRVFVLYGYRHEPYGIRARLLDPECTAFDTEEVVLRDDGGSGDLGYPWSCLTTDGRLLCVYYFNRADGTRHVAGTFLELDDA